MHEGGGSAKLLFTTPRVGLVSAPARTLLARYRNGQPLNRRRVDVRPLYPTHLRVLASATRTTKRSRRAALPAVSAVREATKAHRPRYPEVLR